MLEVFVGLFKIFSVGELVLTEYIQGFEVTSVEDLFGMMLLIWSKNWRMRSDWLLNFGPKRKCSLIFTRSALRIHKLPSCPLQAVLSVFEVHYNMFWSCSSVSCHSTWCGHGGSRTCTRMCCSTTSGCMPSCPRALCRPSSVTLRTPAPTSTIERPPGNILLWMLLGNVYFIPTVLKYCRNTCWRLWNKTLV